MEKGTEKQYLSWEIDFLGNIATILTNYNKNIYVAYELIQNAVDGGASQMTFDFRDDCLEVINNKPFRINAQDKTRDDFERLRTVASGLKRQEEDTIGKFGIGFVSVYRITDHPELFSNGRHWTFYAEREERRIEAEPIQIDSLTRFVFPWAFDDSEIRKRLRLLPVSRPDIDKFFSELSATLPVAVVFLPRLEEVTVKRNGRVVKHFQKVCEDKKLLVSDGETDELWLVLEGSFEEEAEALKRRYPQIESKRKSQVTVAVPKSDKFLKEKYFLYAFLPTEHEVPLPFHINADFFPSSDRRRIVLEGDDYQAAWNRQAIDTAAITVSDGLVSLRDWLGFKDLWALIEALWNRRDDNRWQVFWLRSSQQLKRIDSVRTSNNEWRPPSQTHLLSQEEEEDSLEVLDKLGLSIVHRDLRPRFNVLQQVGVRILDLSVILDKLEKAGLRSELVVLNQAHEVMRAKRLREVLWKELGRLASRGRKEEREKLANEFAVAVCDTVLRPPSALFRADGRTKDLYSNLGVNFVDPLGQDGAAIEELSPVFGPRAAIEALERLGTDGLLQTYKQGKWNPRSLLDWFEDRKAELKKDGLNSRLAKLSVFPSSDGSLSVLGKLKLPGYFHDPLGLTSLIDTRQLEGKKDFLRELGCAELSIVTYAADLPALIRDKTLSAEQSRQLMLLLAQHLGELQGRNDIRNGLSACRLVEANDGIFYRAGDVYFANGDVIRLLGPKALVIRDPEQNREAILQLYRWLGVHETPLLGDILGRIKTLSASPPTEDNVVATREILAYLGDNWSRYDADNPSLAKQVCSNLQNQAWLPVEGRRDRWFKPEQVAASFRYYLFETQAKLLDMPSASQKRIHAFLEELGLIIEPSVHLVLRHLLSCINRNTPVNREVYTFLQQNLTSQNIDVLKGRSCLWVESIGKYVSPSQCFWRDHGFGPYRYKLEEEMRGFTRLLNNLGAKEEADWQDAIQVLTEISSEFGNKPLENQVRDIVWYCWRLIGKHVRDPRVQEELSKLCDSRVIPNIKRMLYPPKWIFLNDAPHFACELDDFVQSNLIDPLPDRETCTALQAAGARSLYHSVRRELLECGEEEAEDDALRELVKSRIVELLRVIWSADGTMSSLEERQSRLLGLRFFKCGPLRIRYCLQIENTNLQTRVKDINVLLLSDEHKVLFTSVDKPALAREMAEGLVGPCPEVRTLAIGMTLVLEAPTPEAAKRLLDELGLPRVDLTPPGIVSGHKTISQIGVQAPEAGEEVAVKKGGDVTETPDQEAEKTSISAPSSTVEKSTERLGEGAATGRQEEVGIRAAGAGQETRQGDETGGAEETCSVKLPMPTQKEKADIGKQSSQGRLRTYVLPKDGQKDDSQLRNGAEQAGERSRVANKGIKLVVASECKAGRKPLVMPPNHPGYDIESTDPSTGEVARYIEVKSTDERWGIRGVGLTDEQFRKAQELKDSYWLYVVEEASARPFIYRIKNPANRVNQFLYDNGWKEVADEVEAPP
jgi:hypothetical protein